MIPPSAATKKITQDNQGCQGQGQGQDQVGPFALARPGGLVGDGGSPNRVTQPNTIVQHKKTEPISHEAITFIDTFLGKFLLLVELLQIPEFTALWAQARKIPGEAMEAIKPRLEEISASLSSEARGALLMAEKAYALYDKNAINEAEAAAVEFSLLAGAVNEALQKEGIELDYQSRLETIVNALGVPGLVDYMMVIDMREWGVDRILAGPISGPARDLLESMLIRGLTDLSAIEAVSEKQAQFKQRIRRKLSPLSRHIKQYALEQRIRLWVRNVVYGESIASIANEFQNDAKRADTREPGEWIKRQIREASMILEVKRPPGRPRKGGVLPYWKRLLEKRHPDIMGAGSLEIEGTT